MLLNAFRTNSRNIIGRIPSMVIPLLANQDLTPMLHLRWSCFVAWRGVAWRGVAWRGVVLCGVAWCGVAYLRTSIALYI